MKLMCTYAYKHLLMIREAKRTLTLDRDRAQQQATAACAALEQAQLEMQQREMEMTARVAALTAAATIQASRPTTPLPSSPSHLNVPITPMTVSVGSSASVSPSDEAANSLLYRTLAYNTDGTSGEMMEESSGRKEEDVDVGVDGCGCRCTCGWMGDQFRDSSTVPCDLLHCPVAALCCFA